MIKLRTLEDFEFKAKSWAGAMAHAGRKYTIDIDELKQEAIKWVKDARDKDPINWYVRCEIVIIFFNIIEEDLK